MQFRFLLGALAALFLAQAARADEPGASDASGAYVGIGIGEARQTSDVLDDANISYRVIAGYAFNRVFSLEAGFIDAGALRDTFEGNYLRGKSAGVEAAVLARLPVTDRIAPYAKLGYVWYDTTNTFTAGGTRIRESTSDEDLAYGFGCEFQLGKHFRLRGEYEYIDVPDVDFDLLTLMALWQF